MTFRLFVVAATVWGAALSASPAYAQYFGRNKVHYKQLDFQVLKTQHFDIYFYPSEREGAEISARMAERWHARLTRLFGHTLRGRQPLVLYASHVDFEQTNVIQGDLGEGTGGVTEPVRRRIVLPLAGPLADTDHVIGHELVHAFQFDMTTGPNTPPGVNGAERLPLWFIEGMAEYLSIGPTDPNTAMWLREAARQEKLPSLDDLDDPRYFPYRWGQAFWAYVGGRWGDEVIPTLLIAGGTTGGLDPVFKRVLGVTAKELSSDWQASIRRTYAPVLANTAPAVEGGRIAIKASEFGGGVNVGPAISPDGRWIAFLSERSLFSIDLFVADAATGRIVRRLTKTATDPHYSSIQFIHSAGAWDAESRRLAIATIASGRPALAVFDVSTGRKEREIPIPTLDEILNPTWAPDGHAICFTGMTRGLTDLYVYDLTTSQLRRLTNDPFSDLQPSWAPDGRRIAFATDRFSSRLDLLDIGDYRLGVIDVGTGVIEEVSLFADSKHITPQWSPDGRALFFVSDRDGIPNLYRLQGSGTVAQLTHLSSGVSGITNVSPAMSVASRVGMAAFSVYEGGKYSIYTLDVSNRGGALTPASKLAAVLPPVDRVPSDVAALLANATLGLPPPQTPFTAVNYKPALSLEGIGQPTIGVGASRFGPVIAGGLSFYFSDLLGNHNLAAATQFNSGPGNFSIKGTAAQVAYINQAHRWNWGVVAGQVPYLSGGFQTGFDIVQGEPVQVDQSIIFRQTERSVSGFSAYPFNRAERIEFMGGISQLSFDQSVQTTATSLITGQVIGENTVDTPLARSLTLGTSSVALVHDTAAFGAISPVEGQRYRIEAAPTFGSINYTSALVDYRRYFMPSTFYTFAGRVLHYGRYGSGSEDPRLSPLSIGYPTLVRGYDINNFSDLACVPEANNPSQCPAFDRLLGSRILIGNLEFRFPLLRPFGASQHMYGPLPVEVAVFADGGLTWNGLQQASTVDGPIVTPTPPRAFRLRNGVTSAGVGLRVNLGRYAIGELDFVRPFQLPNRGWVFQFNLTPGF